MTDPIWGPRSSSLSQRSVCFRELLQGRRTQIASGDTWQRASESRAPIGVEEGELAPPAAPPWSGIKLRPAPLLRGSLSGWLALCRRRRCLVCAGTVQRGRQTGRPPSARGKWEGSLRASPSCLLRRCRPRLGLSVGQREIVMARSRARDLLSASLITTAH